MLPVLQVPNDFTLLPLLLLPLAVNLPRYERPQSVPHAVQAAAAAAVDNGDDDTCNTHAISATERCGPAQATSVRLFNEISKHCKCVQLSKCCTHPSPHSSSCSGCLDSFTFMGTCNEACRGYNPITVKMGIAKSRL